MAGPMTSHPAQPPAPANRLEFFNETVQSAVDRLPGGARTRSSGVAIGIEDVPHLEPPGPALGPLAAALDAVPDRPAQVVGLPPPLEHRAASGRGLRILVHRTIVEQLSALTGRSVDEIDPEGFGDDD
jgi:hypothetical protein